MKGLLAMLMALLCLITGSAMAEAAAQSHIIYVYVTACESCARASAALDALPEEMTVATEDREVTSAVVVERLNLAENLARVQELFAACQVPEDDQIAPIVFLGDSYLSGADAIVDGVNDALASGKGLVLGVQSETAETTEGSVDFSALNWATTAAAGLVGGLNPCALSMLLLFLTTVMSLRDNPGRYAAAFLVSKFVVYLLIGTVLLNAFRAWNPTWLPAAAKWLLTVMGGVLILLNVSDAIAARREQYGEIRNQLPAKMRGFLHGKIKSMLSSRFLMPAVLALGAVVALSEFLCAGQVYLATLLTAVQSDLGSARWLIMLVLYCAAFLIPSTIVCLLVVCGRKMFAVSDWMMEKMPLIKALTAVVLAILIVAAWIL